ncbi:MAG TPA: hypothetical protein VGA67_04925 [Candidatus Dojkabacteria bacterium]|jgi:hypothetical protein
MNKYAIASTIDSTNKAEELLKNKESIVSWYFILMPDWGIKSFIPSLICTDRGLIFLIGSKQVRIDYSQMDEVEFIPDKPNPKVKVTSGKEALEFMLVKIDSALTTPDEAYTRSVFDLILVLKSGKNPPEELLEKLPDQRSQRTIRQRALPLIAAALLLITIGFTIQGFNFVLGWFLILSGFIAGIIGVGIFVFKNNIPK